MLLVPTVPLALPVLVLVLASEAVVAATPTDGDEAAALTTVGMAPPVTPGCARLATTV